MGLVGVLCGENALETRVRELARIEDEVLKWRFRRGSREALSRIYEKYVHLLLSIAMGLLNHPHEATNPRSLVAGFFAGEFKVEIPTDYQPQEPEATGGMTGGGGMSGAGEGDDPQ